MSASEELASSSAAGASLAASTVADTGRPMANDDRLTKEGDVNALTMFELTNMAEARRVALESFIMSQFVMLLRTTSEE